MEDQSWCVINLRGERRERLLQPGHWVNLAGLSWATSVFQKTRVSGGGNRLCARHESS